MMELQIVKKVVSEKYASSVKRDNTITLTVHVFVNEAIDALDSSRTFDIVLPYTAANNKKYAIGNSFSVTEKKY